MRLELHNMQESTLKIIRSEMQDFYDVHSKQTAAVMPTVNSPPVIAECHDDVEMSDGLTSEVSVVSHCNSLILPSAVQTFVCNLH